MSDERALDHRSGRAPRVTLVTRIFAPEPSAASLRLSSLAAALMEHGANVRVLTTTPGPHARAGQKTPDGIAVRRWPALRDRAGYLRGYLPYLSYDVPLFFRVLFGRSADVYICEPPPTTGLALRVATAIRRRPYVYYAADIWSDASAATSAPRFVVDAVRAIEAAVMRGAAKVLAVTDGVRERVAEIAPGADTLVVGHGVDLSRFSSEGPVSPDGTAQNWLCRHC